jgi:large subunit ribosomal protein L23
MSYSYSKIIIKPILTEKAVDQQQINNYAFEVSARADKISIMKAIHEKYNVWPIQVNTVNVKGKMTRYGKTMGQTKNWKKAIVYLKKGDKIELLLKGQEASKKNK